MAGTTPTITVNSLGDTKAATISSALICSGATLNLSFTGSDTIGSLEINDSGTLPPGIYNSSHPTYGSYFTGTGTLVAASPSVDAVDYNFGSVTESFTLTASD